MKKFTLLSLACCLIAGTSFSQEQRIWQGGQTEKEWSYAVANWTNPAIPIPIPTTFSAGASAVFNDTSVEGSETIKISGTIDASNVSVNATKDYSIGRTVDADVLTGAGALTKEGTGTLTLDVKSTLTGGTIIKAGRVMKKTQSTPNVFGAKLVLDGGIANIATTSSSSYADIAIPIEIPAGKIGHMEVSRYSTLTAPISGTGDLVLYAGGERSFIGTRSPQKEADWAAFKGNVSIERYVMSGVNPGFYGIGLASTLTFDPEAFTGIDQTFASRSVTLGKNASLYTESGTKAYAIGELKSIDKTARLSNYYGNSTGPKIYWVVGGLNTDVTYDGLIVSNGASAYNALGFIKVGTGTYTFTNNSNCAQVIGYTVREGRLLVKDDVLRGAYYGAVGCGGSDSYGWATVTVAPNGTLGGTGRIQGNVFVSGKLEAGIDGIGTLLISDSLRTIPDASVMRAKNLTVRSGGVVELEIASAQSYDKINVVGNASFEAGSKIKVTVPGTYNIVDGDKFEILSALTGDAVKNFDVEFPTVAGINWTLDIVENATTTPNATYPEFDALVYKLVLKATGTASGIEGGASSAEAVKVYPISSGVFAVSSSDVEITSVDVYNLQGLSIEKQIVNANTATINLDNAPAGIYFIKVNTVNGTIVRKIAKK